jgi:hypothetical protein
MSCSAFTDRVLCSVNSEVTSEIMNPFRHLVGLLERGLSPTQAPVEV